MNQASMDGPAAGARNRLQKILANVPETVITDQRHEWVELTGREDQKIVLLGAGPLARKILSTRLRSFVVAVADNNPKTHGTLIDGFIITSVAQAIRDFGLDTIFVVTIFNGIEPAAKLRDEGCANVIPFTIFFRHFWVDLLPHASLQTPTPLFDAANEILQVSDLWADEESRNEFASQIEFHGSCIYKPLKRTRNPDETYFEKDIFLERSDERIVDCGAFDGDVISAYLSRNPVFSGEIAAFEPDKYNFVRLTKYIAELPEDIGRRITAQPFAVGNANEMRSFSESGTMDSALSDKGEIEVQVIRLDEAITNFQPTLIKMDIEGAEIEALLGARDTISQDKPILTICTYHRLTDLWRIPMLIHEMCPEYRLYLRRYADDCWDTVCYAIPPQR